MSAKSYKLFSEGKKPVEAAIALNLREPEVTKMHREYWRLRGRDILNLIDKRQMAIHGHFGNYTNN